MPGIDPNARPSIRNVVLVGHGGTGKTTLAEALLRLRGSTDGRGRTFDYEPEEIDREHSLSMAVAALEWREHTVNIIDTPGTPDAIGDAYPALTAADLAVFVIDASVGVQAQHDELWRACDELRKPRIVFLNKLDKERASYQPIIETLRERYGKPLAPVHMPVGVEREFTAVVDLLHSIAVSKVDGKRVKGPIPDDRVEQARQNREFLIEAIVENDDELLERYLEGEVPEVKQLADCFAHGIQSSGFFPVLCGSAQMDIGVKLLADFIVEEGPGPDVSGEGIAAYVAKTLSDPYIGHINIMRSLSGTVKQDDHLKVSRTGADVRMHYLMTIHGKQQTAVEHVPPGAIFAVGKLDDVHTGDLLTSGVDPKLETVMPPEGYYRVAVKAASAGDEDKLSTALARLTEEDPALRVERDAETHQIVLRAYGPTHVDVALARLERKFSVHVERVPLRLSYRETLRGSATGLGRHVKQSGGHGQYGICEIEVQPLDRGTGFEFTDAIVGGVIPNTFIPSVEKGIREAMTHGVLAGYPVVDVSVRLYDGKHHSVDSSQVAFEVAGSLAFRDAAQQAGVMLLEPVMEIEITVPDDLTGTVMGDLSSRRGRIMGTEQAAAPGKTVVRAQVPEAELLSYTGELRSLTSGAGTVVMRYSYHEEVPEQVARQVIAAAQKED
ncbi:MAG: elongation factor G [Nitriliruptorales bacterium]|nr:elongation factor G [Nitriliruptorales bacterium]